MEVVAAVLIFGTLIGLLVWLLFMGARHVRELHRLENSGGYWLDWNRRRFRKGLIPNKFTGQYAPVRHEDP